MSANTKDESGHRRRAAVMADVAKLAGVSHQTVSRVINDSDAVRAETRNRVLSAMRMLNYRPNSVARALVTGRSRTLGVVSFDTTLYGPASTLLAIQRAAHDEGYFVSIVSVKTLDHRSVLTAVERLRAQGVDGILVIAPVVDATAALTRLPDGVPIVAVEAGPDNAIPVVAVDQFEGAATATRHLLELGHRTVRHIAGPASWLEAQQRVAGWRSELEFAGAQITRPLPGDWSARSGYELAGELLAETEVTAVFVANDQMALGVLRRLHEHDRKVPEDISIVGFDDIPEAPYFSPPLTTVRQDFLEMGRRALHLLLEEIGGARNGAMRVTVASELLVRASTGSPPGSERSLRARERSQNRLQTS